MRLGLFLEAYTRIADVDSLILPLTGSTADDQFCRRLSRRVDVIEVAGRVETPFALLSALTDPLQRLASFRRYGRPSLTAFLSPPVVSELRSRLASRDYDLVHLSRAYLAPLAETIAGLCRGARLVIDLDEDEVETRRSMARLQRLNGNVYAADWQEVEAEHYARLLARLLPAMDLVTLSSEIEVRRAAENAPSGMSMAVVPNAVAVEGAPSRHTGQDVIFVGSFGYFPNRDAALWTLRAVWPRIEAQWPSARLVLVGRNPDPEIRRAARRPRVVLRPRMRDIRFVYGEGAVAIIPIRAGGGTRIKLLEAGAHGLPAVSTRLGAEGLAVSPVALADRPQAFADACVELLRSPDSRKAKGGALRRSVRRHHDRKLVLHGVEQLVFPVLNAGSSNARRY